MHFKVDDVRIREIKELAPPALLLREFPCSEKTEELTYNTRQGDSPPPSRFGRQDARHHRPVLDARSQGGPGIRATLDRNEEGTRAGLGHCHARLFREARTTVGWKGLINDPDLDGSFNITRDCGWRVSSSWK